MNSPMDQPCPQARNRIQNCCQYPMPNAHMQIFTAVSDLMLHGTSDLRSEATYDITTVSRETMPR